MERLMSNILVAVLAASFGVQVWARPSLDVAVICPRVDPINHTVYFPHTDDCSKFFRCDNGVAKEQSCPHGLHFNAKLEACDWPINAGCLLPEKPAKPATPSSLELTDSDEDENHFPNGCPISTSTTFIPHPLDCSKFLRCDHGDAFEESCPYNLYFNPRTMVCDRDKFLNCLTGVPDLVTSEGIPELIPEIISEAFPNLPILNPLLEPNLKHDRLCPKEDPLDHTDHFPHETNCSLFYRCDHGMPKLDACPAGLYFDRELQVCVWPWNSGCIPISESGSEATADPSETTSNGKPELGTTGSTSSKPSESTDIGQTTQPSTVNVTPTTATVNVTPSTETATQTTSNENTTSTSFETTTTEEPCDTELPGSTLVTKEPTVLTSEAVEPTKPEEGNHSAVTNPITVRPTTNPPTTINGNTDTTPSETTTEELCDTEQPTSEPITHDPKTSEATTLGQATQSAVTLPIDIRPVTDAQTTGNGNTETTPFETTTEELCVTELPISTGEPTVPTTEAGEATTLEPQNVGTTPNGVKPTTDAQTTSHENTDTTLFGTTTEELCDTELPTSESITEDPNTSVASETTTLGHSTHGAVTLPIDIRPVTDPQTTSNGNTDITLLEITTEELCDTLLCELPISTEEPTVLTTDAVESSTLEQGTQNAVTTSMNVRPTTGAQTTSNENTDTTPNKTTEPPISTSVTEEPILTITLTIQTDSLVSETPSPSSTVAPVTSPFTSTTAATPLASCPAKDPLNYTVHLPHPSDCTKFFRCDHGVAKLDFCPGGLHFNPRLQVCDWPVDAGCVTVDGPSHTPLVTSTNAESTTPEVTEGNTLHCSSQYPSGEEKIPDPNDCSKFYTCENNVLILNQCPPDKNFDVDLLVCDWSCHANCGDEEADYVQEDSIVFA